MEMELDEGSRFTRVVTAADSEAAAKEASDQLRALIRPGYLITRFHVTEIDDAPLAPRQEARS
ncbi:hypothetical protein [Amycolatopsis anabasis]|uniref:hypothetical protein n=1 Tax=Amycolatopsis anabasis TaxID=1840409 RepID=UPI00131C79E5|nr:hypothetical protein [Amycolatopsis anabasis]